MRLNKRNNVVDRSLRTENLDYAYLLQLLNILLRDDSAQKNRHVTNSIFLHEAEYLRDERVMGAMEDTKPDYVDIFLNSHVYYLFGGLVKSGIDYFHARIPKPPSYYFGTSVVSVEARLGD